MCVCVCVSHALPTLAQILSIAMHNIIIITTTIAHSLTKTTRRLFGTRTHQPANRTLEETPESIEPRVAGVTETARSSTQLVVGDDDGDDGSTRSTVSRDHTHTIETEDPTLIGAVRQ